MESEGVFQQNRNPHKFLNHPLTPGQPPFTFQERLFVDPSYPSLEKEMATHSSILAWRILWTEMPGGLQSMGSQESDSTDPITTYPSQVSSRRSAARDWSRPRRWARPLRAGFRLGEACEAPPLSGRSDRTQVWRPPGPPLLT